MPVILDNENEFTDEYKKTVIEDTLKGKPYKFNFTKIQSVSIITFSFSDGSEYSCNRVAGTWMNELNKSIGGKMKMVVDGKVFNVGDDFGDKLYSGRSDVCEKKGFGSYSMPDNFEVIIFTKN